MSDDSGDGSLIVIAFFILMLLSVLGTCSSTSSTKRNTDKIKQNTEEINKKMDTLIHLLKIQNGEIAK